MALVLGLVLFRSSVGNVAAMTPTLTALMVLWVNMVSDAIPSFSLGYDVAETDLMKEKPRNPNESILANHNGMIVTKNEETPANNTAPTSLIFPKGLRLNNVLELLASNTCHNCP